MNKVIIVGSGIAGLSAGYHLLQHNIPTTIYEQNSYAGGLCHSFEVAKGFNFDTCVHVSFAKDSYVKDFFAQSVNDEVLEHIAKPYNLEGRAWLKHPLHNNLHQLPIKERIAILMSFIARQKHVVGNNSNYDVWLNREYGEYFANKYPKRYTRKYWTMHAFDMDTQWLGNRMSTAHLKDMLQGAYKPIKRDDYYLNRVRYPKKGGYQAFITTLIANNQITLDHKVIAIDNDKQKVSFSNGKSVYYDKLISSMPLPLMIKYLINVPQEIQESANRLTATSAKLVSFCFNRSDITKHLWFYIYDEDFLPARAYSPNQKSYYNVPKGCSSLQFEVYYSLHKPLDMSDDILIEHIIAKANKANLFSSQDIIAVDVKDVTYANVIFYQGMLKDRAIVKYYINSIGIECIGRFGEWDYLWSHQSFLSGKKAADKMAIN